MKYFLKLAAPVVTVTVLFFATSLSAQTLADAARAQQKNKKPKAEKVYTNESLDLRPASDSSAKAADDKRPDTKSDAKSEKSADDTSAEDDKKKAAAALKEKFDKQKNELAQLQRELDVMQRENRLRGATFYADAGNRLRNEKQYAEDDRKYQADIANKQKAIADAQTALERMKEEGRRTGVPLS
ncbi:MAG: hypothetical protein JWO13_3447 [Acidobacteriales bacterium]|nr:hypothetical protein [Terriglobales bacterium]